MGKKLLSQQIATILEMQGNLHDDELLTIIVRRTDITDILGPIGSLFTPNFQVLGEIYFQFLGHDQAFMTGELPLFDGEVNPFIESLLLQDLVYEGFRQHFPTNPQLWFVKFRGQGHALNLANKLRQAINATDIPLQQLLPVNPTTSLDVQLLESILHGQGRVGDEGVVTINVKRKEKIHVTDIKVDPSAGLPTEVQFKPLLGDDFAEVAVNFSMRTKEIRDVVTSMLVDLGWYQGSLYNHETSQHPKLYNASMIKRGNAYELASEIRSGLDKTHSK